MLIYRGEIMAVLQDKIIIFFMCFLSVFFWEINSETVICVLIAASISSFCYYFNSKKVTVVLLLLYGGICIVNPIFCIFLPLFVYDIALFRLKIVGAIVFLFTLKYWYKNETLIVLIGILSVALSWLLQVRTEKFNSLNYEYKRLRDTSQELNLYLSKKNKMLIENQDYEIHLATLKERNRIAREIHDNVGHMLSRSLLQVGALMTIYKEEVISSNLLLLKETLNDAMNSIRESVHGLHDDSIDLYSNISSMIQKFAEYKINLDYDMSDDAPINIKYCFIMVIKEGLSNVAKHSNADRIDIIVREHPVFYQFLLQDNGRNGNRKISDSGIGLENMRARVMNLNGTITIDNQEGFKIFITIPKKEVKQNK
ncbi:two-component sensor histidine kinase [Lachnotalea glycerini]|uniref:histidine kinase n=2 Tax=Lachnotalea glycerini TaxID=1763509 RepID=A0A255I8P2_9FIRM|nr:two-component sensor histidine kinase [Lachnotalea glycerini]